MKDDDNSKAIKNHIGQNNPLTLECQSNWNITSFPKNNVRIQMSKWKVYIGLDYVFHNHVRDKECSGKRSRNSTKEWDLELSCCIAHEQFQIGVEFWRWAIKQSKIRQKKILNILEDKPKNVMALCHGYYSQIYTPHCM